MYGHAADNTTLIPLPYIIYRHLRWRGTAALLCIGYGTRTTTCHRVQVSLMRGVFVMTCMHHTYSLYTIRHAPYIIHHLSSLHNTSFFTIHHPQSFFHHIPLPPL
ncbi:hypothetical protein EON63_22595 [archaeon]|nr:MAG: hypothetical protein EON63_22595 [archaeon]